MNEHKTLMALQAVDSKIDALDKQERELPERNRFMELSEEVKKITGLHGAVDKKLHDEAAVQKRLEDDVTSLNAKIEREQKKLYSGSISNPKELAGVQQEVTHLTSSVDNKELALLEQIEVVDKFKSDERIIGERLRVRQEELAATKAKMEETLREISSKRSDYQAERAPIYDSLSEDARNFYNRTRIKHHLAVTVLEEGTCQGCRVELPSTDVQRIEASVKPEKCPSCGRIVVKI